MSVIQYELSIYDETKHLYQIKLKIPSIQKGQRLYCPRWIPGSYLLREYAKHIVHIEAYDKSDKKIRCSKIDNHSYQLEEVSGPVIVKTLLYAWDLSVRGGHLDQNHAFFNPIAGCLRVEGYEDYEHQLEILAPTKPSDWKVVCGLPAVHIDDKGFGVYQATDYEHLVDCPIEMGTFEQLSWVQNEKPHSIAITGQHEGDSKRLKSDVQKICAFLQQWMGDPKLDFPHYHFLLTLTENSYGGLEHRSSTALMAPRRCMPMPNQPESDYGLLLGLFSHEYIHNWIVKRIKPKAFSPYKDQQATPTQQLWIYEGFTSYFDDLTLPRAQVISTQAYLDRLTESINRYYQTPGRHWQTLVESSFDAWIKFYQADENTPNVQTSYYLKGALFALCLDVCLRRASNNAQSLDDFLRLLWKQHHKTPTEEESVLNLLKQEGPDAIEALLHLGLSTTDELPLSESLAYFGLTLTKTNTVPAGLEKQKAPLGMKLDANFGVTYVQHDSAAERAGLAVGDKIVAINQLECTKARVEAIEGTKVPAKIHYFRDSTLYETTLVSETQQSFWKLAWQDQDSEAVKRGKVWLGA